MGARPSRRVDYSAPKRGPQQMQPAPAEGQQQQPQQQQRQCAAYCGDELAERQATRLSCGWHSMHADCLETWRRTCHGIHRAVTCPMCKAVVGPEPPPEQRREALARRAQSNWDAMRTTPQVAAMMRLTRRVGQAAGSTPAMVALLRSLPPQLVADVASNRPPEDLGGAIRDALERLTNPATAPQSTDSRNVAAALADPAMLETYARLLATPHPNEQRQDRIAVAQAEPGVGPEFDELNDRIDVWRALSGLRTVPEVLASIVDSLGTEPEIVGQLVDESSPMGPVSAALMIWWTLAPDGVREAFDALPFAERRRIGTALMHGDDMRPTIRELADRADDSRDDLAWFRWRVGGIRDLVSAVNTDTDATEPFVYHEPGEGPEYDELDRRLAAWTTLSGLRAVPPQMMTLVARLDRHDVRELVRGDQSALEQAMTIWFAAAPTSIQRAGTLSRLSAGDPSVLDRNLRALLGSGNMRDVVAEISQGTPATRAELVEWREAARYVPGLVQAFRTMPDATELPVLRIPPSAWSEEREFLLRLRIQVDQQSRADWGRPGSAAVVWATTRLVNMWIGDRQSLADVAEAVQDDPVELAVQALVAILTIEPAGRHPTAQRLRRRIDLLSAPRRRALGESLLSGDGLGERFRLSAADRAFLEGSEIVELGAGEPEPAPPSGVLSGPLFEDLREALDRALVALAQQDFGQESE